MKITNNSKSLSKLVKKVIDQSVDEIIKEEITEIRRKDRLKGKPAKSYRVKKEKKGNEIEITIKERTNPFLKGREK